MNEIAKWAWIIFLGVLAFGGWFFLIVGIGLAVSFAFGWYREKYKD